ncbi:MAG: hypothetical protein ACRDS9_14855 [Pseudonocardiaceae bacterium]
MNAMLKAVITVGREAFGLLVGDGAVAVGILLAVGAAGLLSIPALLGASNAVGWALFGLVWLALAVSLRRARSRFRRPSGR